MSACASVAVAERYLDLATASSDSDLYEVAYAAILYYPVIIGEAISALSQAVRNRAPIIPWTDIRAMRNELTHEYFRVNPRNVHDTLDLHLRQLADECARLART